MQIETLDLEHSPCYINILPNIMAEDLCVPCAQAQVNNLPNLRRKGRPISPFTRLNNAWQLAELAIATGSIKNDHDKLTALLNGIDTNHAAPFQVRAGSMALRAILPILSQRLYNCNVSEEQRRYANARFGDILTRWHDLHNQDHLSRGAVAEVLALYLSSRACTARSDFLFPASRREESSRITQLNHDAYQLVNVNRVRQKYPFSIKWTKRSEKYDIPVLGLKPILQPVLKSLGMEDLDGLIELGSWERHGLVGKFEKTALDFASHCLTAATKAKVQEWNTTQTATAFQMMPRTM